MKSKMFCNTIIVRVFIVCTIYLLCIYLQRAFHGVPRPDVVALVLLIMGLQIVWQHTPKWRENLWRQSIPVKKRLSVQCIIYFLIFICVFVFFLFMPACMRLFILSVRGVIL